MCIRDSILVTTKKDFETHNRKKFCARIATGDYDAIIMGHSQFERIPIGRVRKDIWYIENWTFLLDLFIIYKTIYNGICGDKKAY